MNDRSQTSTMSTVNKQPESNGQYAYLSGKFVPLEEARISVMTHAFLYGTAVFEGIRAYYNPQAEELYIFRAIEHYIRFKNSCRLLKIDLPHSAEQFAELSVELLRKSGFREDVYIRPVGFKSSRRIGLRLDDQNDFTMFAVPMGAYLTREHPLNMMISSWRRVEDNAIPARSKINGSYVNLSLAAAEARDNGFDEAILLNEDGSVSEAAGMNLFLVRSGTLITPPITDNVLEGITRDTVFTIARELGIPIVERTIDRSELYIADEIFICGTGAEIAPVGAIDHRKIGKGDTREVTAKIQDVYFRAVRGEYLEYRHYLTPVWRR
jgi:branched-chain amino acid aminotransferase